MRVYQLCAAEHALQNIQRSRLKVSTLEDLNDPFELLSAKLPKRALRDAIRAFKADAHLSLGLLCFGTNWDNPVMWSHYGDKHRGVCLGFDIPDEFAIPVKYIKARSTVRYVDGLRSKGVHPQFALDLMRSKFEAWSYENEMRMFIGLDEAEKDQDGLYFYSFGPDLVLREVILGHRCSLSLSTIRTAVRGSPGEATVIKGRLAFNSFRVVPDMRSVR